jgi:hypothetical protein
MNLITMKSSDHWQKASSKYTSKITKPHIAAIIIVKIET